MNQIMLTVGNLLFVLAIFLYLVYYFVSIHFTDFFIEPKYFFGVALGSGVIGLCFIAVAMFTSSIKNDTDQNGKSS
jgi:hypothetical protein